MADYILNVVPGDATQRERARGLLRLGMWPVSGDERHGSALDAGDRVLVYLGAPAREFIGRAEVATAVHAWTAPERTAYPGDSPGGVSLASVEEWHPAVAMEAVLSRLARNPAARADFESRVVLISALEYETVLAVRAADV